MKIININNAANKTYFNDWLKVNHQVDAVIHSATEINITFQSAPTQAVQDAVLAKYNSLTVADMTTDAIKDAIFNAMDFSKSLIADLGIRVVLRGYTPAQVTQYFSDSGILLSLLQSGALVTALDTIVSTTPTAVLPQDDLDFMKQEIETYLGIA